MPGLLAVIHCDNDVRQLVTWSGISLVPPNARVLDRIPLHSFIYLGLNSLGELILSKGQTYNEATALPFKWAPVPSLTGHIAGQLFHIPGQNSSLLLNGRWQNEGRLQIVPASPVPSSLHLQNVFGVAEFAITIQQYFRPLHERQNLRWAQLLRKRLDDMPFVLWATTHQLDTKRTEFFRKVRPLDSWERQKLTTLWNARQRAASLIAFAPDLVDTILRQSYSIYKETFFREKLLSTQNIPDNYDDIVHEICQLRQEDQLEVLHYLMQIPGGAVLRQNRSLYWATTIPRTDLVRALTYFTQQV